MKYERTSDIQADIETLAAAFLNLKEGETENVNNGDEELNLWVSFENGEYAIDYDAWSSLDRTVYKRGLSKVATALEAAKVVITVL